MIEQVRADQIETGDKIDNWTVYDVSRSSTFTDRVYLHVMFRPSTRAKVQDSVNVYAASDMIKVSREPSHSERRAQWRMAAGTVER